MLKCIYIFALILATYTIGHIQAATIRVPSDHSGIQAAINTAKDGDTILVSPGVYIENINYLGKAITVASEQGAEKTIIEAANNPDGVDNLPVVMFISGENRDSVLNGFTLQGARSWKGGGIYVKDSAPTIINNTITHNNGLSPGGGGVKVWGGRPLIQHNHIKENGADYGGSGGGIWIIFASPEIVNNVISYNQADFYGGGIYIDSMYGGLIQNNMILANSAINYSGGGVGIRAAEYYDSPSLPSRIIQNLIIQNTAQRGGGIALDTPYHTNPLIMYNTIAENTSPLGSAFYTDGFNEYAIVVNNNFVGAEGEVAFSCGTLGFNMPIMISNNVFGRNGQAYGNDCLVNTESYDNISVEPRFVDATNDFHLGSRSPLLDAGLTITEYPGADFELPVKDFDGNPRIVDIDGDGVPEVDIGAYERVLPIVYLPWLNLLLE